MESNSKLSQEKIARHIICYRNALASRESLRNPVIPQSEIRYFYQRAQTLQHHVPRSVQNIFPNPEIGRAAFTRFGARGKGTQSCKIQAES